MSFPQDGRRMDRKPGHEGSPQGISVFTGDETPTAPPRLPRPKAGLTAGHQRPQAPPGFQRKDGNFGLAISRPTPVPQWPLPGPATPPETPNSPQQHQGLNGQQAPPRPPRPSKVPSILDASKVQDHTPVFQYRPRSGRESTLATELIAVPETSSLVSRESTISSVGSIPDFPLPSQTPIGAARRSAVLGPPPSARRGASSLYSNASFVPPIPEESPGIRSRTSYASSAAMPESWGQPLAGEATPDEPYALEDGLVEGRPSDISEGDDIEGHRLVSRASVGKRAKPALVDATAPRLSPLPTGHHTDGTVDVNGSSSSESPSSTGPPRESLGAPDTFFNTYSASSGTIPSKPAPPPRASPDSPSAEGRRQSRLSNIWRPPWFDPEKNTESRGSLTSLPGLIRRATRLAASLERGRRPASRLDDLNDFQDFYFTLPSDNDRAPSYEAEDEKHQSGLSDMLAAFPPPAQAISPNERNSVQEQEESRGPRLINNANTIKTPTPSPTVRAVSPPQQKKRRCCGLPLWGFILLVILALILITAAVVIPLEFFVFRKNRSSAADRQMEQCQQQIHCQNGGINIVTAGFCSCICRNGFNGFDCTTPDAAGCTSTTLSGNSTLDNVTTGDAIPQVIRNSQTYLSIPLDGSLLVARFNSGNLSCTAQNALVTFNGRDSNASIRARTVDGNEDHSPVLGGVMNPNEKCDHGSGEGVASPALFPPPLIRHRGTPESSSGFYLTITLVAPPVTLPTPTSTPTYTPTSAPTLTPTYPATRSTDVSTATGTATASGAARSSRATTSSGPVSSSTATPTQSPTPTAPPGDSSTPTFAVTDRVLEFARVAVLFVVQQETLNAGETAQSSLQKFLGSASSQSKTGSVSVDEARNVSMGNGNTVDLVKFEITTPSAAPSRKRKIKIIDRSTPPQHHDRTPRRR